MKYGLIAGNGRFPILALEAARSNGDEVIVIAIKEEASPDVEPLAARCYWISLGELSKLIDICKSERIDRIIMAGQVKHARIFSSIRPDWRLFKLLASLPQKNTEGLIGGVANVLESEGIHLVDSTTLLKPLLAPQGVLTKRKPNSREQADIDYGTPIARALAGLDVGQSVAVSEGACVAVEAMEGTDAMLLRAASLVNGRPLTIVKVATRRRHLLFDVPVIGPETIRIMTRTYTSCLSVESGSTLLLDKDTLLSEADRARVTIVGVSVPDVPISRSVS